VAATDGGPTTEQDRASDTKHDQNSKWLTPSQRKAIAKLSAEDRAWTLESLEIARELILAGVPIRVAKRAIHKVGDTWEWNSTGGTGGCGYLRPQKWQETEANLAHLEVWEPGDALMLITGVVVDGFDCDPRHGGEASVAELEAQGLMPASTGRQTTPSGGWHVLIAPLGVSSQDGGDFRKGVDIKSGQRDGEGRGNLWIAPTVRRVPATMEVGYYRWAEPPDVASVAGDRSGEPLADLIQATRAGEAKPGKTKPKPEGSTSAPDDGLPAHEFLTDGTPTATVLRKLSSYRQKVETQGRHRSMCQVQMALVRTGSKGHAGVAQTLSELRDLFRIDLAGESDRDADREFADGLGRAIAKVAATPDQGWRRRQESDFFGEGGLQVETLGQAIMDRHALALTPEEQRLATYRAGVYTDDHLAFSAAVAELLGQDFRPGHRAAAEEWVKGQLWRRGRVLPVHAAGPVLNCANGMLHLHTGELADHDPGFLSWQQVPVAWDPAASCPAYERWLTEVVGDQAEDLEEVAAQMLDPSRTPTKALLAYGPSRSGKSTFLRLLAAIAGPQNTSGVTLHQLAGNRFAAANVFGKLLNAAADLSAAHVEDLAVFKMLTGEDLVHADRKFGRQFAFTNRALFAFSANEVPTVGESSRAYAERVKPFRFDHSFAGHEDPAIEDAMMGELPGILRRLVAAWQRRAERGRWLDTPAEVQAEFEERSDRVRQWVTQRCTVWTGSSPGQHLPTDEVTGRRELARAFNYWADANAGARMTTGKVIDRLTSIDGVVEVRSEGSGARGLNISVKPDLEEDNGDEDAPGSSGSSDLPFSNRWMKRSKSASSGEWGGTARTAHDASSAGQGVADAGNSGLACSTCYDRPSSVALVGAGDACLDKTCHGQYAEVAP
jgi:P4 family phage/plasmid primase-like protien